MVPLFGKQTLASTPTMQLKEAGYRFPRTEALFTGAVNPPGIDLQFEPAAIGDINTNLFSGEQSWDVCEIGLHPFMLAYDDGFRDYSLIPAYPLRVFRHKSIFIRNDRGIRRPQDLRGKRIATPGYSSTSLTWIRGILQDEYGVKPTDIEWVTSRKDSSAHIAGKASAQESMVPGGISMTQGPVGMDESELLVAGEVDALFHAAVPRAFVEGHPQVARLFEDSRSTEQAYYEKTAIFPIMHAAAVRSSLLDQHAGMAASIFSALRIDEHKICNGCLVIGHPIAQEPETIGVLWIPGTHVAVTQIAPALRSQNAVAQGHLSLAKLAYFSRRP